METIVFGDFTVYDVVMIVIVAAAAGFIWKNVRKFLFKGKSSAYTRAAQCDLCGWQGMVSVHAGRCPKCNNAVGPQKAKRGGY